MSQYILLIFMKGEDLFWKLLRRGESTREVGRALFTCLKPRAICTDSFGMFQFSPSLWIGAEAICGGVRFPALLGVVPCR